MNGLGHNGGPAFPMPHQDVDLNGEFVKFGHNGMTLRDYFAAQALAIAAHYNRDSWHDEATVAQNAKRAAIWAYCYADAMIAAREGSAS